MSTATTQSVEIKPQDAATSAEEAKPAISNPILDKLLACQARGNWLSRLANKLFREAMEPAPQIESPEDVPERLAFVKSQAVYLRELSATLSGPYEEAEREMRGVIANEPAYKNEGQRAAALSDFMISLPDYESSIDQAVVTLAAAKRLDIEAEYLDNLMRNRRAELYAKAQPAL